MRVLSSGSMTVLAAFAVLGASAMPVTAKSPLQLSESQLDKISAGTTAVGSGTGLASSGPSTGSQAAATVIVVTTVGPGANDAAAVGQVNAAATSPNGAMATATASLSLAISLSHP
jgi:hypothetical protein